VCSKDAKGQGKSGGRARGAQNLVRYSKEKNKNIHKEKKMKKILVLSIALIAVIALASGGTWAYFNDVVSVDSNSITAGTLYFGTAVSTPLSVSQLQPNGSSSTPVSVKLLTNVQNAGNLTGKLNFVLANLFNLENTRNNAEMLSGDTSNSGELGSKLMVALWFDTNTNGSYDQNVDTYINSAGTFTKSLTALDYSPINTLVTKTMTTTMAASAVLGDLYINYYIPNSTNHLPAGIYEATIANAGSGYAVNDVLTVGGTGTGAVITVNTVDALGAILTEAVTSVGTGYGIGDYLAVSSVGTANPALLGTGAIYQVATLSGSAVATVTQVSAGTGYAHNNTITGGSGQVTVGAIKNGAISTAVIANAGTGYHVNDVLTIGGSGAGGKVIVDTLGAGNSIATYHLDTANTGSGYSNASGVATTVSPAGGSNATFDITKIDGVITSATLTNAGCSYNSGTKTTTTTGAGTGATVTIKAASRYYTDNVFQGDSVTLDVQLELTNNPA
jgi:predicted ribosomally synthesized peptide with SipW-like signal peptide